MVDRIIWLTLAMQQYGKLSKWLYKNASINVVESIDAEFDKKLARICKQPTSGRPSKINGVRFVLIKRRWRFYYRDQANAIYIVYIRVVAT
jgi:plasmid stabilization system protein ParE